MGLLEHMNSNFTKRVVIFAVLVVGLVFTLFYGLFQQRMVEARITRIEGILERTAVMKQETAEIISKFEPQNEAILRDLDALAMAVRQTDENVQTLADSLKTEQGLRRRLHRPVVPKSKRPSKQAKVCTKESEKRTPFGDTVMVERVLTPVPCHDD